MEDLFEFFIEFMGAVRGRAVSDGTKLFCSCCSRATCLTVPVRWSIRQSNSANTCHLGLITHLVLAASEPTSSISPT